MKSAKKPESGTAPVGRYAPSPTGSLHLGNLRTALAAYCFARSRGGRFLLRIEDIDTPRVKAEMEQRQLDELERLGINWDEEPLRQSIRSSIYRSEFEKLKRGGHVYPCFCSRKDIQLALSAPHREDDARGYPGTCRELSVAEGEQRIAAGEQCSWRVRVDDAPNVFHDGFHGALNAGWKSEGDFAVLRADGLFAYQLVCAVDDALSGVTEVLRGDDLLESGARQNWLLELLELPIPKYYHIPLMLDQCGKRLSKRTGAADLEHFVNEGYDPVAVGSYLAYTLGQCALGERLTVDAVVGGFCLQNVPKREIGFSREELGAFI